MIKSSLEAFYKKTFLRPSHFGHAHHCHFWQQKRHLTSKIKFLVKYDGESWMLWICFATIGPEAPVKNQLQKKYSQIPGNFSPKSVLLCQKAETWL